MKVIVKLLGKPENSFEVSPTTTVASLKVEVGKVYNVPAGQQKLVLKGKTLNDESEIGSHEITEGEKIFLFVKKSDAGSLNAKKKLPKSPLFEKVEQLLLKHFPKESVPQILDNFEKKVNDLPYQLSLEDIERIASANLEAGKNSSWCGRL